jgi:AraC-like DNA-binding protein
VRHRRPLLIAAGLSDLGRAELRHGVSDAVAVQCLSWPAPLPTSGHVRNADGFVIELAPTDVQARLTYIRLCVQTQPLGPVIVCCDLYRGAADHLHEAVCAGATTLSLRGYDKLAEVVRSAFHNWQFSAVCRATLADVLPHLPKDAWPFMDYCIKHVQQPLTVADVAQAIDIHPRRLHRILVSAGLPAPVSAISWSRLFVATRLMTIHDLAVERAALMVGFTTGSGLRNMLKHYVGLRPREINRSDALRLLMDRFVSSRGCRQESTADRAATILAATG